MISATPPGYSAQSQSRPSVEWRDDVRTVARRGCCDQVRRELEDGSCYVGPPCGSCDGCEAMAMVLEGRV